MGGFKDLMEGFNDFLNYCEGNGMWDSRGYGFLEFDLCDMALSVTKLWLVFPCAEGFLASTISKSKLCWDCGLCKC